MRALAVALIAGFWFGFWSGATIEHRTCRAVETVAPWVAC
jgi:hypothetical protein